MRTLILSLLVGTLPVAATAASAEREALLLNLLRQNGCSMSGQDAQNILPKHGFTPEETREIEAKWLRAGWIDTSQLGTISLTREACKS